MKILQLVPSLVSGGAEQAVVDINAGLIKAGLGSLVVSAGGPRAAEIAAVGGQHITLPLTAKNPAQIIANAWRLADLVRTQGVDLIHARSRAPAWSGWLAARLAGLPFVTTFHAAYKFSNPAKRAYNGVMARGARVIAISEFIAAHIREHYPFAASRVVTIPRGLDLALFAPEAVTSERTAALRAGWGVPEGTLVILMPARLSPIKGHLVLIEALKRLRHDAPALRFHAVIVGAAQGRDAYSAELRAAIAAAGLAAHVTLAEVCRDMPAAYAAAALAVAPSLVPEGFGRVPVEAQAMGVPVIASDLGGFRETILPDVTGWLVSPGDAAALAERMGRALTRGDAAALATPARHHVAAHYDMQRMVAATLDLYRQVLAESRP